MDWQRNLLISAIVAVVAVLFIRWNEFEAERQPPPESVESEILVPEMGVPDAPVTLESSGSDIPETSSPTLNGGLEQESDRLITVRSDVLELTIDTYGGDIVRAALLDFPLTQKKNSPPMVILNRTANHTYIAQSGLIGPNGTDTNKGRPTFSLVSPDLTLNGGQDQLVVDMVYPQGSVKVTKRFVLNRGDYFVKIHYLVENNGSQSWTAGLFGQIQRDSFEPTSSSGVGMKPYVGAATTTPDKNYKKIDFGDLEDGPFKTEKTGGFIAMVQHYFISAWVPDSEANNHYTLKRLGNKDLYTFGFSSPAIEVAPGSTGEVTAGFYVGPKDQYRLEEISPYLDLTVDYGWLWWIAKPIFYVLHFIHSYIGNWGWSIILLTVLIKLAFFQLSATSYKSMARMRKLQPEMARLKDLYGDDRQKLSQEMMNFYKKEKVNPMGGCLPILVQMPVFIALYWVLSESVELRQAPWVLWITDLSVKDPYFVLPVLNGIAMFVTTLLQPEPPDPTQAKIMKIMPVAFSFLFAFFPAGLVLYWTVNSVLSIAQQWVITKKIEAAG
jgi:YidC/Oxa1 family membrane protein insertase